MYLNHPLARFSRSRCAKEKNGTAIIWAPSSRKSGRKSPRRIAPQFYPAGTARSPSTLWSKRVSVPQPTRPGIFD